MKYPFYGFYIFLLLGLILAGCKSEPEEKKNAPDRTVITQYDANSMFSAFESTIYAIELAEEGIMRSTGIETKTLADNILVTNKKIAGQLQEIAGKKGVELPFDMNSSHLKKWRELVKEKGWKFDKKLVELAIEHSQNAKVLFSDIKRQAKDADIRKVADSILSYQDNQHIMALQAKKDITNRTENDTLVKPAVIIH